MNGNRTVQQNIPIPKGFEYVTGQKINGFVIRNTADGTNNESVRTTDKKIIFCVSVYNLADPPSYDSMS